MKKAAILALLTIMIFTAFGCGKVSKDKLKPLVGLSWYESYEDVKSALKYTITKERSSENAKEKIIDYTGAELFGADCDLTLCFSESGLIGLNYHDIKQTNNYQKWFSFIESRYGYPTEESSGMASWYDDPLGKNTSVYLFNLEEGVQISFYTSASSPDKSYSGGKKEKKKPNIIYVPEPELRTPVVPVETETVTYTKAAVITTAAPVQTQIVTDVQGDVVGIIELPPEPEDISVENGDGDTAENEAVTTGKSSVTTTAVPSGSGAKQTSTTAKDASKTTNSAVSQSYTATTVVTTTVVTTTTHDYKSDFKINGISFYGSPDTERKKMSGYNQLYEYEINESGQPWQLVMEYSGVEYGDKNCDAVLCFTSLGLVGVNYFDSDASNYRSWITKLTSIYGRPKDKRSDYSVWNNDPVGKGTVIYVFALEDGVQISFFTDDTGSEIAK